MHLERNPIVCVLACAILISRIQSWVLGHVEVVIISQEVILQMDKEQRLSSYTCNSNSHIFLKLIYLNKRAISHDINYLHAFISDVMLDTECFIMEQCVSHKNFAIITHQ